MKTIIEILSIYGFATLAAVGMAWFIWFVYNFTTNNIKKNISETHKVLIALLDRIRMLDNDIIRLRSKLDAVIQMQENEKTSKSVKESNETNK
tara:strand:- start:95 stop:373 length:279 start_codon:yes stop_codon:yes gene_type:complete